MCITQAMTVCTGLEVQSTSAQGLCPGRLSEGCAGGIGGCLGCPVGGCTHLTQCFRTMEASVWCDLQISHAACPLLLEHDMWLPFSLDLAGLCMALFGKHPVW